MKTVQTKFTAESDAKAKLFKQLFLTQIELGKHVENPLFKNHLDVSDLIEHIDRLMEAILTDLR